MPKLKAALVVVVLSRMVSTEPVKTQITGPVKTQITDDSTLLASKVKIVNDSSDYVNVWWWHPDDIFQFEKNLNEPKKMMFRKRFKIGSYFPKTNWWIPPKMNLILKVVSDKLCFRTRNYRKGICKNAETLPYKVKISSIDPLLEGVPGSEDKKARVELKARLLPILQKAQEDTIHDESPVLSVLGGGPDEDDYEEEPHGGRDGLGLHPPERMDIPYDPTGAPQTEWTDPKELEKAKRIYTKKLVNGRTKMGFKRQDAGEPSLEAEKYYHFEDFIPGLLALVSFMLMLTGFRKFSEQAAQGFNEPLM